MSRNLRASVDHEVCVGTAACTRTAPRSFALNPEMQSQPIQPPGDDAQRILDAAENCPVSAITVVDADTGEQLFP
jgi:ferredoxin